MTTLTSDSREKPVLGIIVPCFNEEEIISYSAETLLKEINDLIAKDKIAGDSFVAFVDDGSRDKTWDIISSLTRSNSARIKALKLSNNHGHQAALLAGLHTFNSQADALVSIDADLQDDISVIGVMIDNYVAGSEIVYGVRKNRPTDTVFKRRSAAFYYRFAKFFNVPLISNHADFRLMSRRVVETLTEFTEANLFLRGIFPLMGFNHSVVYYDRKERTAGSSKYTFLKMLSLAWDGVSSFSVKPLHLLTIIGVLIFAASLIAGVYVFYALAFLKAVPGWASIVLPMYLLGGIQLLAIGVIGEYLGKIYREVKRRPRYIVDEVIK